MGLLCLSLFVCFCFVFCLLFWDCCGIFGVCVCVCVCVCVVCVMFVWCVVSVLLSPAKYN